ncbi:Peptidoglycan/LPS O-acetylase OafA/YrhL, contains acyltransferase and SGNH-hydrolase domains [Frankineae bacterium MT45]|nr:Peptidoglycan/LPS O-acetylase OafA/YrhL, contains acyltransferase and SGNH-hydrolase domains [Frankineae bacterium MT45]
MTQILERPSPFVPAPPIASKPQTPVRKFRPDIEGIRALAVLSVVLYHAHLFGIRGGFVGVDVFFVISGFLITRQLVTAVGARGLRSLPDFYIRRIKRLLPASAAVVLATLLVARFWAPALQVRSIATDAIYTTFYGMNYRLAVSGTQYLHQTDAPSPLQHFWSLAVEEQFYIFWPILIVAVTLIGRRFKGALLTVALLAITAISFHFSVTVTRSNAPWAYFSLHTRAWELALGALVAVSATQLARIPAKIGELAAWSGLIAVIASAFVYSDATPYPGSAAALPVVGTAVLIAAGCGRRRRAERILAEPLMQCFGKVSYSWYLWHWPMLMLAPAVLGHNLTAEQRLIVVLASLAMAVASFFLIENPARLLPLSNARWFVSGLAISATIALCGGIVLNFLPQLTGTGAAVTIVQADSASPQVTAQMKAAVVAGLATTNAPSNLTPQPAQAAADTPPSSRNGCHADFLVVTQGACVFGDPAGTHVAVLFGDSHMEQWLPAFANAGAHSGWKIINWTKAACPPAQLSVYAPTLNRAYTECDTWRAATLKRIAALKPDQIFMSQSENVVSSKVSPSDFANATVKTLDQLKASVPGAKVNFLNDVPVPNYDMPGCVAQHLSNVKSCNFAVKAAYTYPSRHAAMQPTIQKAGFAVVDPQSWVCSDGKCPAVVGNYLTYRNTTHLSASFSQWLTPMVAPLLTVASRK